MTMRPKKIHLSLKWAANESIVKKRLWLNNLYVEYPHLEKYDDSIIPHFEEKEFKIIAHHDTELEVRNLLKELLVALSEKKDDISSIEISTDICLDDIEDGLWLTSLMPESNVVTNYSYSVNLLHIANYNNQTNETN